MQKTIDYNPILSGFHPDPSICRVDDTFYIITSSFEYFPGIPIFKSTDLHNWEQVGHIIDRPSQLPDLKEIPASNGIWAPTIRYHENKFYVIVTFVQTNNCPVHYLFSADSPEENWSEPIIIEEEFHGIDPSLFFDNDNKVYLTVNGRDPLNPDKNGIIQCEIDIDTGKTLSDTKFIWEGSGADFVEGAHLYKINNKYYLTTAEGGTSYGHLVAVGRSDSPWGPFENCPHNPILTQCSLHHPVKATGHGDLVQTKNGDWFMVFLGIRPVNNKHVLGRETFIQPVNWTEDGWPIAGNNNRLNFDQPNPVLKKIHDDFSTTKLDDYWNFCRLPDNNTWSLTENSGHLRLKNNKNDFDTIT